VNLNHEENKVEPQTHAHASPGRQNNSLNFIKAHLNHAIVDIGESISVSFPATAHLDVSLGALVMSLLGFAVSINSA
jgi:hypothetical protein